jgi:pimeloyl-ACP methyl ester carboxylesterase
VSERTGGIDIFIGGGGDDLPGFGVMRAYAAAYAGETGRPTLYFPNGRKRRVLRAIARHQDGGPVNLIGHSWGAIDAYNVAVQARRRGLRVDNLLTVDPVGGRFLLARPRQGERPGNWTSIVAEPPVHDQSDRMAVLGGKPSRLPIVEADRQCRVEANHFDVEAMMAAGGRAVLDASRRLDDGGIFTGV